MNDTNTIAIKRRYRQLYKCQKRIDFLEICVKNNVQPTCAKVSSKTLKNLQWSKTKIQRVENENLQRILNSEYHNLSKLESSFQQSVKNLSYHEISNFRSHYTAELEQTFKNENLKRQKKLSKLINHTEHA